MYVPVLKNRTVEVSVLSQLAEAGVFNGKDVVPLVELIQERTRSNNKNTFLDDLAKLLKENPCMTLMVDFYKSTKLSSTTLAIRNYVSLSTRQMEFCITEALKLGEFADRVIPVVSYLNEGFSFDRISYETIEYRKVFPRIAFRIKTQDFDTVFSNIENLLTENDIVLLDIESASHMNPVFKKIYKRIANCKKQKKIISVVVNANRPESLTNKAMINAEPIAQIDNSLKELYNTSIMNKFDGFGDYACIVASLPTTGGAISPAGVYYSNENNFFVAYKGRTAQLSEFPEYIAPNIVSSEYWKEYTDTHHDSCPGCQEILSIVRGDKSGKNQGQWKMITMLHYIYTLYEDRA